jgi:hypothetical protein
MAIKLNSVTGAVLTGIVAFAAALVLNKYDAFSIAPGALWEALGFAVIVVVAVQAQTRTERPLRSFLFGCIGSAVLFRYLCWDPLFDNPGTYDVRVALGLWAGMTILGLFGIIALERVDRPSNSR